MLGDRIGIMGHGKLLCCGSSRFLKDRYGEGYSLTIEKEDADGGPEAAARLFGGPSSSILAAVSKHVPGCTLLTEIGSEIQFQLPKGNSDQFPSLFRDLDAQSAALGVRSYGVSVTTMDTVFLKVVNPSLGEMDAGPAKAGGSDQQASLMDGASDSVRHCLFALCVPLPSWPRHCPSSLCSGPQHNRPGGFLPLRPAPPCDLPQAVPLHPERQGRDLLLDHPAGADPCGWPDLAQRQPQPKNAHPARPGLHGVRGDLGRRRPGGVRDERRGAAKPDDGRAAQRTAVLTPRHQPDHGRQHDVGPRVHLRRADRPDANSSHAQ